MEKTILSWVKNLNTNFKTSILQCGCLSEQFEVQRGCSQVNPIAPYLYLLCAEILAMLIKQNVNIKEHTIHVTQYVDDTSLILDGSPGSLFNSLDTIDCWIGSKKFQIKFFITLDGNQTWLVQRLIC